MTELTPNHEAKPVAFFDFDGTLTTGDTLMPFLKYVVGAPEYYAKLALVSPVLMAYFAKMIRNDIAKQIVLRQYLAGYHVNRLFELGSQFSEDVILAMLRPAGIERLRWHREQGHRCVLLSASLDVYLNSWAKSMSFSDCICTSLKHDYEMNVSGRIDGINCYGKEKVKRIMTWQQTNGASKTFAYGDTVGDMDMLRYADHGYMLNKRKGRFEAF